MQSVKSETADRELIFSRVVDAPVDLVWEIWTKPKHIKNWWGPDGFTNTIFKMEVKSGGEWDFIMHSPDGIHYRHKCIFRKLVKNKLIIYEQLTDPKYLATVKFETKGDKTSLYWQLLFESHEYMIEVVKTFKVDPGLEQTALRMIHYLLESGLS
jgi:uncharacterized protein YndB with AHSA1/START domain